MKKKKFFYVIYGFFQKILLFLEITLYKIGGP